MKTKTTTKQRQLKLVAGFVPERIEQAIKEIAQREDRSISQVVRRALEQSPLVQDVLNSSRKVA